MTTCYDVVYTWVDDSDPVWRSLHDAAVLQRSSHPDSHPTAVDSARYTQRGELQYSIKSIFRHAPWVRTIYVLTNCALPGWADAMPRVVRVDHEAVFPRAQDLPTFNSHAIETVLHRIEGLAERFLYFNDDVFLCRSVQPEDFFWGDSGVYIFPSRHDIPYNRAPVDWRPVDQGAINSARLLERDFGFRPKKKLHHAPFALTKSILREIEQRYKEQIEATRSHAFRHPDDVAMATTLHANYAQCSGRGKARAIASRYVDIGDWRFLGLVHPWSPLMRGRFTTLCLNEVTSIRHLRPLRDAIISRVMRRLFG